MHCDNLLTVASFSFLLEPEGVEAGFHDAAELILNSVSISLTLVSAGTTGMPHHS